MFGAYLWILFYFLFFAESMGRTYVGREYHYNLVPFREIMRFVRYRESLGNMAVILNLLGNIFIFVPFGIFLPLLARGCRRFPYMVFLSFDLSLVVEILQLLSKVGSFDVDDLLLNTLGGAIGYIGYLILLKLWRSWRGKKKDGTQ